MNRGSDMHPGPSWGALRCGAMVAIALTLSACTAGTQAPAGTERPSATQDAGAAPELPQQDAGGTGASAAPGLRKELAFQGAALEIVRKHGLPANGVLEKDVKALSEGSARLEECSARSNPADAILLDLDGDGVREGLSIYTLTACKVGGNVTVMALFRQDPQGNWKPISETALTVGNQPPRPILDFDPESGTITLAGSFDALSGTTSAPDVIQVPDADGHAEGETGQ